MTKFLAVCPMKNVELNRDVIDKIKAETPDLISKILIRRE